MNKSNLSSATAANEIRALDKTRVPELYAFFQRFFPAEELFSWEVFNRNAAHSVEWTIEDQARQLLAALCFYEEDAFIYGMFLAVSPRARKKGFAGRLLRQLLEYADRAGKPLLGEIEPVDENLPMTVMRAQMYSRLGFQINPQPYQAPNCASPDKEETYWLISYPRLLTADEFAAFVPQIRQLYFL